MDATAERTSLIAILTAVALAALTASTSVSAGGVVGTCDETHLNTALSGGGTVTFTCGPATITVTSTKTISANTTIDGGGVITISGGNSVQVFTVNPAATFVPLVKPDHRERQRRRRRLRRRHQEQRDHDGDEQHLQRQHR